LKDTDKETYWREIAAIIEGRFFVPMDQKSNRRSTAPAREN
jgi:hypothetical protein